MTVALNYSLIDKALAITDIDQRAYNILTNACKHKSLLPTWTVQVSLCSKVAVLLLQRQRCRMRRSESCLHDFVSFLHNLNSFISSAQVPHGSGLRFQRTCEWRFVITCGIETLLNVLPPIVERSESIRILAKIFVSKSKFLQQAPFQFPRPLLSSSIREWVLSAFCRETQWQHGSEQHCST